MFFLGPAVRSAYPSPDLQAHAGELKLRARPKGGAPVFSALRRELLTDGEDYFEAFTYSAFCPAALRTCATLARQRSTSATLHA